MSTFKKLIDMVSEPVGIILTCTMVFFLFVKLVVVILRM